jgi:hypothetical protein
MCDWGRGRRRKKRPQNKGVPGCGPHGRFGCQGLGAQCCTLYETRELEVPCCAKRGSWGVHTHSVVRVQRTFRSSKFEAAMPRWPFPRKQGGFCAQSRNYTTRGGFGGSTGSRRGDGPTNRYCIISQAVKDYNTALAVQGECERTVAAQCTIQRSRSDQRTAKTAG